MRADRLLSLLILLQTRGRMTARELAGELEVSQRTVYRDIDALSAAGVPVYAERGAGGGCALLEDYRTTLTGLTDAEIKALFMLNIPAPLIELGISDELKSGLLKLAAALPDYRYGEQLRVRQRFHLDSTWWFQADEPVPHLQALHRAVWEDRTVRLTYRQFFGAEVVTLAEPYSLVAKAGVWYVVCAQDGSLRVHRVSDLLEVELCEEGFQRSADFDLAAFWDEWCRTYENNRPRYPVTVRIAPELVPYLTRYFGERVRRIVAESMPDEQGWLTLPLHFETFVEARTRLLGLGRAVEVLEPTALRLSIIDFASQIVAFYQDEPTAI